MTVANQSRANPLRNLSHTVQLAPYLVEAICELTRAVRDKTHAQTEISGLLFGSVETGATRVDALKTFKDSGPRSDLARRERLDKAFITASAEAAKDAELAALKLVGWFSLRGSSGLLTSDIDFHNRHFKSPEDLALVIWREADTQAIVEIYSKVEGARLSADEYRWSSVRLSTEMRRVSEPIDLAMRAKVSEDHFLKPYQTSDNDRREEWKKMGESVKQAMLAFLPGKQKTEPRDAASQTDLGFQTPTARGRQNWDADTLFRTAGGPELPYPSYDSAREPSRIVEPEKASGSSAHRERPAEVSGLPMVIGNRNKPARAVPWVTAGLVFLLFSGITFAVLAVKGLGSNSGRLSQIMRVIFPGTDLGVHVDSQGDRLLLSWNRRNLTVASASDAILQIFDGAQHRVIHLDPAQVADGSVLYKPVSNDVTFRLEVHGNDQSTVMGSQRVLDATGSAASGRADHTLDLSKGQEPAPVAPVARDRVGKPAPEAAGRPAAAGTGRRPMIYRNGENGRVSVPVPLPPAPAHSELASNAGGVTPPVYSAPSGTEPSGTEAANAAKPQSPAAPVQTSGPQSTAGSVINGWDSNAPENRRTPPQQREETAAAGAKPGSFVSPTPLLQVMPNTKYFPAGAVSEVTRVEVQVTIDPTGHVSAAHALNDSSVKSVLSSAAVSAARQWTFQPATLRGEKVSSEHTILFEFRPEAQAQR